MNQPLDPRLLPARLLQGARRDPAEGLPGAPPAFGQELLPHIYTVGGRHGIISSSYLNMDEALRDSPTNAERMRADCGIMECIEARQRATALLPWHVEPADSKDARQVQLAADVTDILEETPRFTELRRNLLEAIWYGRYATALQYGKTQIKGRWLSSVKRWEPRHGDKIVFRYDDGSYQHDPEQIGIRVNTSWRGARNYIDPVTRQPTSKVTPTYQGLVYWLDRWERETVVLHKHMIEDGPYNEPIMAGRIHGVGVRDRIYWTWYAMVECLERVVEYLDRAAFGIEVWPYQSGNPKAKQETEAAAMQALGGGRTTIDIIRTYFGHKIKRYILGQTLTSRAGAPDAGVRRSSAPLSIVPPTQNVLQKGFPFRTLHLRNCPIACRWKHVHQEWKRPEIVASTERKDHLNRSCRKVGRCASVAMDSDRRARSEWIFSWEAWAMRLLRYSCIAASALLLVALGGCRTPEGRIATAANPCCAAAGSPHEACADCLATRGVAAVQHVEEVEDEEEPRGIFTVSLAQPTQLSPAADFDYGDAELVQGVPSEERGDDLSDEDRENSQRAGDELSGLVAVAMAANPQLRRMQAEAAAAWQRVPQLRSLPDPMLSGTVFGEPMMMGGGEMRATLMLSQTLPLLRKLDARAQQASFEALILGQQLQAARWEVSADVQEAWYRLYLLGQLLRINESNQQLVESLLTIATIRVEVGDATPGDVILGTLELSRQEEERLLLQQQVDSRRALLNQLLGRPADSPIALPQAIEEIVGEHSLESLRAVAFQQQPEIVAARLRTEATNWGIRLAELERVPDPTVSFEQMFMKMDPGVDRPNPWQVGLGVNLPLWHPKYQAMRREATEQHFAAHSGVEEAVRATESRLLDLLAQVQAAHATTELYRETILPQARQAVEVDQRAYGQGAVQFERVIANARNLLTAESAYHRAVVDRAVAVARLEQAAGGRLPRAIEAFDPPASFEPIPLRE